MKTEVALNIFFSILFVTLRGGSEAFLRYGQIGIFMRYNEELTVI